MCETSTDFLLFLVSVIRSEIRWAKQVQDMLVSPSSHLWCNGNIQFLSIKQLEVMRSTRCRLPPGTNRQFLRKAFFH